jgi:hypothetical protein
MKFTISIILSFILLFSGCGSKTCNEIPYWDGRSVKDFEGKTLESMLWLWLPAYEDGVGYCIERSTVFKRFDEDDYEILLRCLENPEIRRPMQEERLGRYLYLSFLDGSRYIIDFRFTHENESVILLNGQSKILYKLLGEKEPSPTFEPTDPRMDLYGEVNDPNMFTYPSGW